jgi:hypothetical protein
MQEEQNQIGTTQTKVELQILPDETNIESTAGKIILSITCDGSKLSKVNSRLVEEFHEEVWVTIKTTKADAFIIPNIELSVHEKCTTKMTKADSGKTA